LEKITMHINKGADLVEQMIGARKKANVIEGPRDKAIAYCEEVKPYFDKIRYHVDKLELHIDDNFWPLPKYREMLFLR
jgi:glutamine synthetase